VSERKARSSVYHEKLAVMTMPELTLTNCSKQMRQLPGMAGKVTEMGGKVDRKGSGWEERKEIKGNVGDREWGLVTALV